MWPWLLSSSTSSAPPSCSATRSRARAAPGRRRCRTGRGCARRGRPRSSAGQGPPTSRAGGGPRSRRGWGRSRAGLLWSWRTRCRGGLTPLSHDAVTRVKGPLRSRSCGSSTSDRWPSRSTGRRGPSAAGAWSPSPRRCSSTWEPPARGRAGRRRLGSESARRRRRCAGLADLAAAPGVGARPGGPRRRAGAARRTGLPAGRRTGHDRLHVLDRGRRCRWHHRRRRRRPADRRRRTGSLARDALRRRPRHRMAGAGPHPARRGARDAPAAPSRRPARHRPPGPGRRGPGPADRRAPLPRVAVGAQAARALRVRPPAGGARGLPRAAPDPRRRAGCRAGAGVAAAARADPRPRPGVAPRAVAAKAPVV